MKSVGIIALAIFMFGCSSQQSAKQQQSAQQQGTAEKNVSQLLEAGIGLLQVNPQRAINDYFDKAINQCADQYQIDSKKIYAARSPAEAIVYAALAAAGKADADVVDIDCADALFLKGYASVDLGQLQQAEAYFKRALAMAPENSQYLSELGNVYQTQQNWTQALAVFQHAESAAELSPIEVRQGELTRAKRGQGFNLIELGELDKAEAKFNECLALDNSDQKAQHELKYIQQLRAQ